MAWAILDNLQMTGLINRLVELGFYLQVDRTMSGADALRLALEDPQIPYQVAEAHTTATFTGLLLTDTERATEVAGPARDERHRDRDVPRHRGADGIDVKTARPHGCAQRATP